MDRQTLGDGDDALEVTSTLPAGATRTVLFAVGGGGDPTRHGPLLDALAARGCAVIAPHAARLASPHPTADELVRRARGLRRAADALAPAGAPVVGVGHSIGATVLLALAGATAWLDPTSPVPIPHDARLARLALLAPATGFFLTHGAHGALAGLAVPVLAWAGGRDVLTPPAQAARLADALPGRVELRVAPDAGHYTFMDLPPPHAVEPHPDRAGFLAELAASLAAFANG